MPSVDDAVGSHPILSDLDLISNRRVPNRRLLRGKRQDGSEVNALSKFHALHSHSDELEGGMVEAGRDPGDFVNPFQQVAAEEESVIIAEIAFDATGGWEQWIEARSIVADPGGLHNLCVIFVNPDAGGPFMNLDWLRFE